MFRIFCCCIHKNSAEEVISPPKEPEVKEAIEYVPPAVTEIVNSPPVKTIIPTQTSDFNPTTDSVVALGELETIPSEETMSDNDSVVAVVNNAYSEVKEQVPLPKKKLKSSSKYILGKNVAYFYLNTHRYYFIKNKNDNKEVFFGKFITIDKVKKNCVIFEISNSGEKEIFDSTEYFFYRAIPKNK
jgi:hypothetical protein